MRRPILRIWAETGLFWKFVLLVILAIPTYLVAAPLFEIGGVAGLESPPVKLARLDQEWEEFSDLHHHTSQGTKILPLSWFLALEQPVATPLPVGRYASRDYLARFGFLYPDPLKSGADQDLRNPDLPVGFAIERDFRAPYAHPPIPDPIRVVGLTCAGCHTGRIDLKLGDGKYQPFLIDGGSAMINLSAYQKATAMALFYTQFFPMRFDRFAREVDRLERMIPRSTPPPPPDETKIRIKKELETYISLGLAGQEYAKEHKLIPIDAGFSRTDALGLIGNRVFGVLNVENQTVTDAPVNFPHLWDTPWFDWVQYNASIRTPMARNIGEALGVGALVNLTDPGSPAYESTVNVENLHAMESWISGNVPFSGLQPPRWDDLLAKAFPDDPTRRAELAPKSEMVENGSLLYKEHCERCHLPSRDELEKDLAGDHPRYFTEKDPSSGRRFLRLNVVDLSVIGTDLNQALNFYRRVAVASEPEIRANPGGGYQYESNRIKQVADGGTRSATISAEEGLFRVTSMVRERNYRSKAMDLLAPPEVTDPARIAAYNNDPDRKAKRQKFDGFRGVPQALDFGQVEAIIEGRGMDWVIEKNLGYKARPLDGIWATPPYLHNGSVPNLYQILVPVADRFRTFYLGSTRFDPRDVGYETHQVAGSFLMDTSLSGNRNEGHEFRNLTLEELEAVAWDGKSTLDQRWALALGLNLDDYSKKSPVERWELVRKATSQALRKPSARVIRGVLGPEFREEERRQLVEYLKTL
ncbi:di-heme-cytochrome C peroxidase [Tundrisphaera lichenicola]|uniref:di-heme-cytochrome C peroxidase n=1 Tax=Tundrisphaera lichenicola TaxID=2029860 RepID=UPI003EBB1147